MGMGIFKSRQQQVFLCVNFPVPKNHSCRLFFKNTFRIKAIPDIDNLILLYPQFPGYHLKRMSL